MIGIKSRIESNQELST